MALPVAQIVIKTPVLIPYAPIEFESVGNNVTSCYWQIRYNDLELIYESHPNTVSKRLRFQFPRHGNYSVYLYVSNNEGTDTTQTDVIVSEFPLIKTATVVDEGYLGEDSLSPTRTVNVGISTDRHLKAMQVLPNNRLLITTDSGVHLYDKEYNLINRIQLTDEISKTEPIVEGPITWTSSACCVPVFHINPNIIVDARKNANGFIVVRRTADFVINDEIRITEDNTTVVEPSVTYAKWNIHFDPEDLSEVGPIIGSFHFKKDVLLSIVPSSGSPVEVKWIEGLSVGSFDPAHESSYDSENPYLARTYLVNKENTPPLSRYWDSYVIFKVLINVGWFRGSGTIDTDYASAYLIFTNAAARNEFDPPLKLREIRFIGTHPMYLLSHEKDSNAAYGDQTDGAYFRYLIATTRLPIKLAYNGSTAISSLAPYKYLYGNVFPSAYKTYGPGLFDNPSKIKNANLIPPHGVRTDYTAITWDMADGTVGTGESLSGTPLHSYRFISDILMDYPDRSFIGGMVSTKAWLTIGPFVPGIWVSIEAGHLVLGEGGGEEILIAPLDLMSYWHPFPIAPAHFAVFRAISSTHWETVAKRPYKVHTSNYNPESWETNDSGFIRPYVLHEHFKRFERFTRFVVSHYNTDIRERELEKYITTQEYQTTTPYAGVQQVLQINKL